MNSDNHSYLTINCDTGQHSQFLRCFNSSILPWADEKAKLTNFIEFVILEFVCPGRTHITNCTRIPLGLKNRGQAVSAKFSPFWTCFQLNRKWFKLYLEIHAKLSEHLLLAIVEHTYRGAFFAWRAPILSWPRIMWSQVHVLKFLEPSREMP